MRISNKKSVETYTSAVIRRLVDVKALEISSAGIANARAIEVIANLLHLVDIVSFSIKNEVMKKRKIRRGVETGKVVGPTRLVLPVLKVTIKAK
jgi:hypothetical protein